MHKCMHNHALPVGCRFHCVPSQVLLHTSAHTCSSLPCGFHFVCLQPKPHAKPPRAASVAAAAAATTSTPVVNNGPTATATATEAQPQPGPDSHTAQQPPAPLHQASPGNMSASLVEAVQHTHAAPQPGGMAHAPPVPTSQLAAGTAAATAAIGNDTASQVRTCFNAASAFLIAIHASIKSIMMAQC